MTEEDTFNRLRRTPIQEMILLHRQERFITGEEPYSSLKNLDFARRHGWDWSEYITQRHVYVSRQSQK